MTKTRLGVALLAGFILQAGCATTPSDEATLLGAGIGAGLGAILGHNMGGSSHDRELGMAAGALIGGTLGNQYSRQATMEQQLGVVQAQQFYSTIWIENANGSKTPVQIRQTEGGQYIGPRGEYYDTMPTDEQLKQLYGM